MTRWPDPARSIATHPPLPEGYRIESSRTAKEAHAEALATALLTEPSIYWGKGRTREQVRRQIERCEGAVVLRWKEDGEEELVGSARVVTDLVG